MTNIKIEAGQIRWVDFGKGDECIQGGIRPALVNQNNKGCIFSPLIRVIPLTTVDKARHLPTHVFIPKSKQNGLKENSIALMEQERGILKRHIGEYIGTMEFDLQWQCSAALLKNSLDIYPPEIKDNINNLIPVKII